MSQFDVTCAQCEKALSFPIPFVLTVKQTVSPNFEHVIPLCSLDCLYLWLTDYEEKIA